MTAPVRWTTSNV